MFSIHLDFWVIMYDIIYPFSFLTIVYPNTTPIVNWSNLRTADNASTCGALVIIDLLFHIITKYICLPTGWVWTIWQPLYARTPPILKSRRCCLLSASWRNRIPTRASTSVSTLSDFYCVNHFVIILFFK